MADAGYMSEQDSARLSQLRDEALKGLPKELAAKVKWMMDDMIKGYSKAAAGERNLMTPLERKDLEAQRYKGKLDGLSDILPSLPKDGAAAKIVDILKDVAKYGVLNDATIKQLQSLTMRIDQDDEAGMRVVRLVKELVHGELGRILTAMSRPQPANPARPGTAPARHSGGRDLDARGGDARAHPRRRTGSAASSTACPCGRPGRQRHGQRVYPADAWAGQRHGPHPGCDAAVSCRRPAGGGQVGTAQ